MLSLDSVRVCVYVCMCTYNIHYYIIEGNA